MEKTNMDREFKLELVPAGAGVMWSYQAEEM
jgi:hypothetical protein